MSPLEAPSSRNKKFLNFFETLAGRPRPIYNRCGALFSRWQKNSKTEAQKMKQKRNFLVLPVALALVLSSLATAQQTADASLVYVPVAVTGQKNAYLGNLTKDNFRLLEDGIEQTITSFQGVNEPMDVSIILALGALQRGRATLDSAKIREALENFRQQGNPKNRYTVEEMPFGANGIFDAISRHATRLHEQSTNPRKALLVLTDGFESSGGDPGRTLSEYVRKLTVPIHIIWATGNGEQTQDILELGRGQQIFGSGGQVYEDIARFSGGRLYQAEADTQLRAALENLSAEFKNQYVLGFKSTNDAKNDKWRKLEVKFKAPFAEGIRERDLKTKVRDRYFVAKVQK
jgi:Ca-activated chloride channel family protein